jgi:DNA-binding NtrC family response regulator
MVKQELFREDLYYRLNVTELHVPPLRERGGDVAILSSHFLQRFTQQFGKAPMHFSGVALCALEEHNWPGNVRQLENVVQRAVVLAEGSTIEVGDLPTGLSGALRQLLIAHSYDSEVREFKRRLVRRALEECGGNKTETARALHVARGYLHRLINELRR